MELEKFKEKNRKKTGIVVFTVCCILLIAGVFFYNSFALFNEKKNFNVINGNVEDPGDLYFAYYIDDVLTYDIPTKDDGYVFSSKSNCTNGVIIAFDETEWMAKVYFKSFQKGTNSRVKCNLYFEKKKTSPIENVKNYLIAKAEEGTIVEDDETSDHNLRYVGIPKNYIDIGDKDADGNVIPWRIIGVMNNIDDGTGNKASRLKVIRSESIGGFSWDTSVSSINSGYGINEWSQADLMKLLNPGYESEAIGGSLYYNKASGNCYKGQNNATTACDFTSSGLSEEAKNNIDEILWSTGSNGAEVSYNYILTNTSYELERSNNNGKICSSGSGCNDRVTRTTTWLGRVGLLSPSDYGYATNGGLATNRETCLNTKLYSWDSSSVSNCKTNDWLYNSSNRQWTIMPLANSSFAYNVIDIHTSGRVINGKSTNYASGMLYVRPVVYLKADTEIISGDGTINNMFIVE